jgi:hypothetical protein
MQATVRTIPKKQSNCQIENTIETTLYELIEAISQEVEPEEDSLIAATVRHLTDTGKVKILRS